MKKIIIIISLASFFGCNSESKVTPVKQYSFTVIQPDTFRNGEILFPDYANADTLLVLDAYAINEGVDNIDGSDYSIDSLLHAHCAVIGYNSIPMAIKDMIQLHNESYCWEWAFVISFTEHHILPETNLYQSMIED